MIRALPLLLLVASVGPDAAAAPLDAPAMQALLGRFDEKMKSAGDFTARAYIETKEKDKPDVAYDAVYYRHDADDRFLILFLAPKAEAGKGYLRIDQNLWMYDPTVGKWERRTERERIGGTGSQRGDFDPDSYANDFTHTYVAEEKLGRFTVHHLKLVAKAGVEVASPTLHVWFDAESENLLKVQEHALSDRLMRTVYYPKWEKIPDPRSGRDVYYAKEIRIFDEVEKENRSTIAVRSVDLADLPANMFTKAWLESKSR
ncbi:MAG: outer membrane lipoprotein-sorting protein [Myxococcales bacterium]|nr:outer membrane lipoprotein-sorting protein [Myxococcales bacterium]